MKFLHSPIRQILDEISFKKELSNHTTDESFSNQFDDKADILSFCRKIVNTVTSNELGFITCLQGSSLWSQQYEELCKYAIKTEQI